MASPTLQEQLGAMALVDELRHQRIQLREHMGIASRRAAVAERLREYYGSKNIEIDDDLINRGVEEYFSKRFVYEPYDISGFRKALAELYISRGEWGRHALVASLTLSIIVGVIVGANSFYKSYEAAWNERQFAELNDKSEALSFSVAALESRLQEYRESLPMSRPVINRLLDGADALIEEQKQIIGRAQLQVNGESISKELVGIVAAGVSLSEKASEMLDAAAEVPRIDDARISILNSSEYKQWVDGFPVVGDMAAELDKTLDSVDVVGIGVAKRQLDSLFEVGTTIKEAERLSRISSGLSDSFAEALVDEEEKVLAGRRLKVADEKIQRLSLGEAAQDLNGLGALLDFVKTGLEIKIVDRTGVKSGIERTNANGGKSWYLVVEGLDAAGHNVPVEIKSAETGEVRSVAQFGIQVDKETFEAVRRDKLDNGLIDDRSAGVKKAGRIRLELNEKANGSGNMIWEW